MPKVGKENITKIWKITHMSGVGRDGFADLVGEHLYCSGTSHIRS